jgi:ribonuclease HI
MAEPALLTIHTDGASRGNPGPAAFAYVIARGGHEPIEEAGKLGRMTNNQAEYLALIRALEHALEIDANGRVLVNSDSELLVKQMRGEYRVKNEDLRELYEEARALCGRFRGGVTFLHVRREENKRADQLGNEALDGLRDPTPRASNTPRAAPRPPAKPSLRDEGVARLRRAAAAWASGAPSPTPEEVWDELLGLMKRNGFPSSPGGR